MKTSKSWKPRNRENFEILKTSKFWKLRISENLKFLKFQISKTSLRPEPRTELRPEFRRGFRRDPRSQPRPESRHDSKFEKKRNFKKLFDWKWSKYFQTEFSDFPILKFSSTGMSHVPRLWTMTRLGAAHVTPLSCPRSVMKNLCEQISRTKA